MDRKRVAFVAVAVVLVLLLLMGCAAEGVDDSGVQRHEEAEGGPGMIDSEEPEIENLCEVDRIRLLVETIIDEAGYKNTVIEKITVNENLSTEEPNDYIALIYLAFDIKNTRETGNKMMRMYSDDMAATMADKGMSNIGEASVFWKDEHNSRTVKYAYEYRDGGFYLVDVMGE